MESFFIDSFYSVGNMEINFEGEMYKFSMLLFLRVIG